MQKAIGQIAAAIRTDGNINIGQLLNQHSNGDSCKRPTEDLAGHFLKSQATQTVGNGTRDREGSPSVRSSQRKRGVHSPARITVCKLRGELQLGHYTGATIGTLALFAVRAGDGRRRY